jgi:hypothetical protein
MRSARYAWIFCFFFFAVPTWAQQTQPLTSAPTAPKDAQAVDVVNQALAAAGGVTAITAISDYTGSGNITYHWGVDHDVQGSVTTLLIQASRQT